MIAFGLKAVATLAVVGAGATAGFFALDALDGEDPEPAAATGSGLVVRALGDSVTAGYGYADEDGDEFGVAELPFCAARAGHRRCQDPDGVAYPAVYARSLDDANFQSYASSGSTPADWLGEGKKPELNARLQARLAAVVAADPDLTVLSLGANPLLNSFLTDVAGRRLCATTRSAERARECIRAALAEERVEERLQRIYGELLDTPPDGRRGLVVVFQYPESRPPSAIGVNVAVLVEELRAAISRAAALALAAAPASASRLVVAEPGPFLAHGCGRDEPWILTVDTCIHPNAAGHAQLARALAAIVAERREAAARPAVEPPARFAEPGTSCGIRVQSRPGLPPFESRLGVVEGRRACAQIERLFRRYAGDRSPCDSQGAGTCWREYARWRCVAPTYSFYPADFLCYPRGSESPTVVGLYPAVTTPMTATAECGSSGQGGGPFEVRANFDCEAALRIAMHGAFLNYGFLCATETTGLESSRTSCRLDAARLQWVNGS